MQTVEYAAGRLADVFGDPARPTVLLWHGQQADARSSVRSLAELIASRGLGVVAPDWNSYAADRVAPICWARSNSPVTGSTTPTA